MVSSDFTAVESVIVSEEDEYEKKKKEMARIGNLE